MTVAVHSLHPPRQDDLRDRLVTWCEIASGSDDSAGLAQMRAELRRAFRVLPAVVEEVPATPGGPRALRITCRPEAPRQVLLIAHFDTVYGRGHPFRTCEPLPRGRLRGPGVADDKGGIVVLLAALEMLEGTEQAHQLGWQVILGDDEEIGSPASASLYRTAAGRHDLGLVFEPCREDGGLVSSRMGTGKFIVTAHGRAAHAGRAPEQGRNAVLALAEYLLAASRLPDALPGTLVNVARIQGGGPVNMVPDRAVAEIGMRVTRPGDDALVIARLRELAAPIDAREGYRIEVAGRFQRPPMTETQASRALFAAYQECGRMVGVEIADWQPVGGASDGNLLAAEGLPVLDGLGGRGGALHSEDEWVDVASLAERARVAALLLVRLAAGEVEFPRRFEQDSAR